MAAATDPRRLVEPGDASVRPVVARPSNGVPVWVFAVAVGLVGLILFAILESRRQALTAPATRPRAIDATRGAAPPPALFIPPEPRVIVEPFPVAPPPLLPPRPLPPLPAPQPRIVYVPQPLPPIPTPPAPSRPAASGPVLVVDTTTPDSGDAPMSASASGGGAQGGLATAGSARARATQLRQRATTVPQGTLIPAVLETALDSTRPGQARALVSRDVRGFDGSQVLIPRGSRLFGEYRADLQPGQNRALVTWSRLVRPDGVSIAIGSPAADALGRAGIRGNVNSHFLERLGSAILQSSLDIGVNLASRAGSGSVVVVPNGASQFAQPLLGGRQIQPTLTVRQGARISVFVARDLDFTAVETKR